MDLGQLPAVCNSLGIKIDPTIVHMSINNGYIDQGGKLSGKSVMAAGEVMEGNAGAHIIGQDNVDKFENSKSKASSAAGGGANSHQGGCASNPQCVKAKKMDGNTTNSGSDT